MRIKYRNSNYEYNPPTFQTGTWETDLTNVEQKSRWLFLNRAKYSKRRSASMLTRSAQEIGLV